MNDFSQFIYSVNICFSQLGSMTSSPHFVGPAASAFPASPDWSGHSAPTSREGPKFPPGALCPGIQHVRRGAGVQRITKPELFPNPTSCTRPPFPGFSLYSCVSICCWNYSPAFNTFHSLSCPCLPLFPSGPFLSFILLVLAGNTAHPLQMTQKHNAITWSDFLFCHWWQTFPPGPTQPDQRISLVSVPSCIKSELSGLC